MENTELILGLYIISEYMYCQKSCFYKFYGFEESSRNNLDFAKGKIAHNAVLEDSIRYKKGIKQYTDLKVFSHKYGLTGKLDLLECKNNNPVPIEYKKGTVTDYLNHKIQLCLEVLCVEEMYSTQIDIGYIYFTDANKRVEVKIDTELRNLTVNLINEIRQKLGMNNSAAFSKENNHKCPKCTFYETCMPNI